MAPRLTRKKLKSLKVELAGFSFPERSASGSNLFTRRKSSKVITDKNHVLANPMELKRSRSLWSCPFPLATNGRTRSKIVPFDKMHLSISDDLTLVTTRHPTENKSKYASSSPLLAGSVRQTTLSPVEIDSSSKSSKINFDSDTPSIDYNIQKTDGFRDSNNRCKSTTVFKRAPFEYKRSSSLSELNCRLHNSKANCSAKCNKDTSSKSSLVSPSRPDFCRASSLGRLFVKKDCKTESTFLTYSPPELPRSALMRDVFCRKVNAIDVSIENGGLLRKDVLLLEYDPPKLPRPTSIRKLWSGDSDDQSSPRRQDGTHLTIDLSVTDTAPELPRASSLRNVFQESDYSRTKHYNVNLSDSLSSVDNPPKFPRSASLRSVFCKNYDPTQRRIENYSQHLRDGFSRQDSPPCYSRSSSLRNILCKDLGGDDTKSTSLLSYSQPEFPRSTSMRHLICRSDKSIANTTEEIRSLGRRALLSQPLPFSPRSASMRDLLCRGAYSMTLGRISGRQDHRLDGTLLRYSQPKFPRSASMSKLMCDTNDLEHSCCDGKHVDTSAVSCRRLVYSRSSSVTKF